MTRSNMLPPLQRQGGLRRAVFALTLCAGTLAVGANLGAELGAAQRPADSADISLISLETDCFGCSTGERLVLRRDGQASLIVTGKARHRTQDQVSVGWVGGDDFEALARLTLAQGFMALQDVYDDPQTRDGAWIIISIEHSGGKTRQVFRREGAGPAALDVIEAALQDLRGRIAFKRKHL
ncbi:hypothetical protein [Roseateles sp.]|uniref:hypothetical protein n=1 Tax=Roseateles sp. TaxID=1971397 RepID=UPI00286BDAAC|nr:hypothetical protein [Roseateles sp.]